MKAENKKLQTENKNFIMKNKTLINCLARLEKKMDELKEDIRRDIARDVKTIVIETMKEENEKNQSSKNGKDIIKQVKEFFLILQKLKIDRKKREKII